MTKRVVGSLNMEEPWQTDGLPRLYSFRMKSLEARGSF